MFAVGFIVYHHYQVVTELPYVETAQITDPVRLTKTEYYIGETVEGFFEGERYIDLPVIVNRTLVCDDFRAVIEPFRVESLPVGRIDNVAVVLELSGHQFVTSDAEITPQTGCKVIYSPQTIRRQYPLGGEELQQDQSFRTTEFDILAP